MDIIFRKDKKTGEIIAFFPETYNEYRDYKMVAYEHTGQHFSCIISYYWETKKASPEEYKALLNELTNIVGYENLRIKQRMYYK